MNNILVTGGNGQLGSELKELAPKYADCTFFFTERSQLDITDHLQRLRHLSLKIRFTPSSTVQPTRQVDKAEERSRNMADAINHLAVGNLARIAKDKKLKLVHISTDYVFDGTNKKLVSRNGQRESTVGLRTNQIGWRTCPAKNQPSERHHHQNLVGLFQIRA